jgi:uncharacterized protein (TIGR00251 family)
LKSTAAIHETRDGVSFGVRVNPRASRTRFLGVAGEGPEAVLKIALSAPPVDGRANEALISYLADVLDVPRSAVEVASGEHSRNKVVRVMGRTAVQVENAFQPDKKAQVP